MPGYMIMDLGWEDRVFVRDGVSQRRCTSWSEKQLETADILVLLSSNDSVILRSNFHDLERF